MTELATVYQSSKGPKLIAELPFPYLLNARDKLVRTEPHRTAEIAAMTARIDSEMDSEIAAKASRDPQESSAPIGHNMPPEPTAQVEAAESDADPFEAIRVHIEDLYIEAKNWADGAEIETDAQAAEVDRLIDAVKDAIKAAEAVRDRQIEPLSAQVTAIREQFYPLIGETKKVTGTAIRAKTALLAVKTKWGAKVRAAQAAEAERLRQEAFAKAKEAVAATRAAPDNLEVAESAEDMIRAAQANLREAKAVEAARPLGFRTVWRVEIADDLAAIRTMWKMHPDEFKTLALDLARREVREGRRQLEGFSIAEDKVAA